MKKAWILAVVVLAALSQGVLFGGDDEREAKDAERVLKETKIESVKFDGHSLTDVLNILGQTASVNIVPSEEVANSDAMITLTLNNPRSIYDVFKIINRTLPAEQQIKITYEGFLMVRFVTEETAEEYETRVYNVASLQFVPQNFPGPDMKLSSANGGGFLGDLDLGGGDQAEPATAEDIADSIQRFTGGNSWEESEFAKLEIKGKLLIVKQTPEVHDQINDLLLMLASK